MLHFNYDNDINKTVTIIIRLQFIDWIASDNYILYKYSIYIEVHVITARYKIGFILQKYLEVMSRQILSLLYHKTVSI